MRLKDNPIAEWAAASLINIYPSYFMAYIIDFITMFKPWT